MFNYKDRLMLWIETDDEKNSFKKTMNEFEFFHIIILKSLFI